MKIPLLALLALATLPATLPAQTFRPNVVNGAVLGGLAGAVIGNNSGHRAGEGALIGALAGALLGDLTEQDRPAPRVVTPVAYQTPPRVVTVTSPPAPVVYSSQTTVVYSTPAPVIYSASPTRTIIVETAPAVSSTRARPSLSSSPEPLRWISAGATPLLVAVLPVALVPFRWIQDKSTHPANLCSPYSTKAWWFRPACAAPTVSPSPRMSP